MGTKSFQVIRTSPESRETNSIQRERDRELGVVCSPQWVYITPTSWSRVGWRWEGRMQGLAKHIGAAR